MYIFLGYLVLSIIIFALDQLSKWWVVSNISLGESIPVLKDILSLTYVQNKGAAWSLMDNQNWFIYFNVTLSFVVTIVCLYFLKKKNQKSPWLNVSLVFIMAGAMGNGIDRIHWGFVVDMIQTDFINYPIFNLADISLVSGVICMLIYVFLEERAEKRK